MRVRRRIATGALAVLVGTGGIGAAVVGTADAVAAASTGTVSTIAGNGTLGTSGDNGPATAATLNLPFGVAYDKAGNLYVADLEASEVRKVAPNGTITAFAGTGTAGFSGDGGPATSAALARPNGLAVDGAGNVYIADYDNNRIRKVTPAGTISTFAGTGVAGSLGDGLAATLAQLHAPSGLVFDGAGRLLIADYLNNKVRRVGTDGTISTVAGTGAAGFTGDGGAATAAQLNLPVSVAFDTGQNLVISDAGNNRIRRIGAGTGIISTIAGTGASSSGGDGGPAIAATFNSPRGVVVDNADDVFVADSLGNRVRRIGANGIISTVLGDGTPAYNGDSQAATKSEVSGPFGLAISPTSDLIVADGGNHRVRAISGIASQGYLMAASDGGVFTHGSSIFYGSEGALKLVKPIVTMAATPTKQGYWLFASDGGVFTHGDAGFFGSQGGTKLNQPVVAAASTPSGHGYWLFASDGGVFTHGDAAFYGSEGGLKLVKPIVASAATPSGHGYWLFASDGGVFTHGDAAFFGSEGGTKLNQPIVAAASTPSGHGYWLFASDGGVFTHGDAAFYGSEGALKLNQPIVAAVSTPTGAGYWLFASDGGVFTHGDAAFYGSEGALKLVQPIVAGTSN